MTVGVIAKLSVAEGKNDEFEKIFTELSSQVHANEPGNYFYQIFKSRSNSNDYVVLEQYADDAALDAHGRTEHFLSLSQKMGACLAGAPSIEVLDGV